MEHSTPRLRFSLIMLALSLGSGFSIIVRVILGVISQNLWLVGGSSIGESRIGDSVPQGAGGAALG